MSDTDEIQTLHALNDAQAAEIARLTAELEKCKEDAERLRLELSFIAVADTRLWDDKHEFQAWAQNRARHALAARKSP